MPKNNNLKPVELPMKQKWGKEVETEFKNNLDSIKVTLVQAPTLDDLRSYLPAFAHATWSDYPLEPCVEAINESGFDATIHTDPTSKEVQDVISKAAINLDKVIYDAFTGKTLPTALETIRLTFSIEGISLQEVTHIIRYRNASFSAECSGDKWWTDKVALVPNSVEQSDEFYERYKNLMIETKKLYQDMIDSKKISIMDARYILPRGLETFYFMSLSLKDAIHFIKQRIDKQIQPETDNILAYQMYQQICEMYPLFAEVIDIRQPSWFYVKTARTGRATNLYFPDKDSDIFEWNEKDFIYQAQRNEMNGTNEGATNKFDEYLEYYTNYFEEVRKVNREVYPFLAEEKEEK